MNPSEVLAEHARACDEIHQLALGLRDRLLPAETFSDPRLQEDWAAALVRLNESCARLQALRHAGVTLTATEKAAAGRLARRTKDVSDAALESENLMLGQTLTQVSGRLPAATFGRSRADVAKLYGGAP
jgi:hypothetical protein